MENGMEEFTKVRAHSKIYRTAQITELSQSPLLKMGGGGGGEGKKVSISKEVSALIKQGFIPGSSAHHSSPSRTAMGSPSFSSPSNPSLMNIQSSPIQSEMMYEEQLRDDKIGKLQERVWGILDKTPFQNPPKWAGVADLKLSVSSKDGCVKVWVDVHRKVLISSSGFFLEKLGSNELMVHTVEICDCDDVEVYLETVALMYCVDMEEMLKRLMGQTVDKVLSLLKVCVAIKFGTGIETCLTYLEAVPWHEEEEKKVSSVLSELHSSDQIPVNKVLERLSPESCKEPHETMLEVMKLVLLAKDDKAQRDMKTLVSRLIKETTACRDNNNIDFFREVNNLCGICVSSLIRCSYGVLSREFHQGDHSHRVVMGEIAKEADNMQWIVDILIDNRMGDCLVELWADQKELASFHARIPPMYRYEISRITTQLFIAIGRRQIWGSQTAKSSLLKTWLDALYGDYEWMKRCCRSFDQKLVEEGLSQTILTLSCDEQQPIILNWFHRYLNKSDDFPNLSKALEVWWRRTYIKQHVAQDNNLRLGSLQPER